MNALRDLWPRLRAALWVRFHLVRAQLGGRGSDGVDYHLADHEIPRAGIDYQPLDMPAEVAGRLGTDIAQIAGRSGRARRRRASLSLRARTVAMATAALLGLAVVGVGAGAIVGGSTGVPEVDRLLGIEAQVERRAAESGDGAAPSSIPRSGASVSVETDDGAGTIIATSFVSRDDLICTFLARGRPADETGSSSCRPPRAIAEGLTGRRVVPLGIVPGSSTVWGFVSGDVRSLVVREARGAHITLSDVWAPDVAGAPVVREFLAVPSDKDAHLGVSSWLDPGSYELAVERSDAQQ